MAEPDTMISRLSSLLISVVQIELVGVFGGLYPFEIVKFPFPSFK